MAEQTDRFLYRMTYPIYATIQKVTTWSIMRPTQT